MVYRNRIAAMSWAIALAWNAMLAVMTGVALRDGAPAPHSPAFVTAVLGVFWLAGIAVLLHVARQPCVQAELFDDGGLEVRARYLLRTIAHRFDAASRPVAALVESQDSDGDPYFACEIGPAGPFRRALRIAEGPRERCDAVCSALNAARR